MQSYAIGEKGESGGVEAVHVGRHKSLKVARDRGEVAIVYVDEIVRFRFISTLPFDRSGRPYHGHDPNHDYK